MASIEMDGLGVSTYDTWRSIWSTGADDWARGQITNYQLPVSWSRVDYFPYGCAVCRRSVICGSDILKCSKCKRVSYCSREHQKMDWKRHKRTCCSISSVPLNSEPLPSKEAWISYLRTAARTLVPRLTDNIYVWNHQPHCQICYVQTNLSPCSKCGGAACCINPACGQAFAVAHSKEACELHCVRIATYVMALQQQDWLRVSCRTRCDAVTPPLSFPKDWGEYFKNKMHDYEVPYQLMQLPPVVAALTDGMSSIMMSLHALKILKLDSRDNMKAPRGRYVLSLHFVGAEMYDMLGFDGALEEILHWVSDCNVLDVTLVGPDLPVSPGEEGSRIRVCQNMCEGCTRKGCEVYVTCLRQLYHTALETGACTPPSLAICPNSGIHEKPALAASWAPTLVQLYERGVPTVFTSYAEDEINDDFSQIKNVCGVETHSCFPIKPARSPFRGLLPMPDTYCDNEFYYSSNYYFVMHNKNSSSN